MKTLEHPAHSPSWFFWFRPCGLLPPLAQRVGTGAP